MWNACVSCQFSKELYRVAAIFPEHFQSFTVVLKNIFLLIILHQIVSAICRSIKKNNNTYWSKVESTGSYKSRDSKYCRLRAGRIQMETSITSRRTLRRCGGRRSGLLALLSATLLTILYGASLSYGSMQSFTTISRIWSRIWRSWWGSLPGTSWRRPARASGPGLRLSSLLTAVLLDKLILNMYICNIFLTSIKSDDFQLCGAI